MLIFNSTNSNFWVKFGWWTIFLVCFESFSLCCFIFHCYYCWSYVCFCCVFIFPFRLYFISHRRAFYFLEQTERDIRYNWGRTRKKACEQAKHMNMHKQKNAHTHTPAKKNEEENEAEMRSGFHGLRATLREEEKNWRKLVQSFASTRHLNKCWMYVKKNSREMWCARGEWQRKREEKSQRKYHKRAHTHTSHFIVFLLHGAYTRSAFKKCWCIQRN